MKIAAAFATICAAVLLTAGSAQAACQVSDVPEPNEQTKSLLEHPQFTSCVASATKKWPADADKDGKHGGTKSQEYCWCLFVQTGSDEKADLTTVYGDESKQCWENKCEEWSGWK